MSQNCIDPSRFPKRQLGPPPAVHTVGRPLSFPPGRTALGAVWGNQNTHEPFLIRIKSPNKQMHVRRIRSLDPEEAAAGCGPRHSPVQPTGAPPPWDRAKGRGRGAVQELSSLVARLSPLVPQWPVSRSPLIGFPGPSPSPLVEPIEACGQRKRKHGHASSKSREGGRGTDALLRRIGGTHEGWACGVVPGLGAFESQDQRRRKGLDSALANAPYPPL